MNLFKRKPKEETVSRAARFRQQRDEANIERLVLRDRLERIAAHATVKRMAAIARSEEPQSRDKQQAEVR